MIPITAIFGGTFDPIHNGHLGLAQAVIDSGHADHVTFIPARIPPHKQEKTVTDGATRLKMIQLAIADNPQLSVSDWELQRNDVSYTWHTANHFAAIHGDRLRLLIGMDSLVDLHTWYKSIDLVNQFRFIVYRRPESPSPPQAELEQQFGKAAAARLISAIIDGPPFSVSSTAIRQRAAKGKAIASLLPNAVTAYITANQLYKEPQ